MAEATGLHTKRNEQLLFWSCFVALVATAFAFVIRGFILHELQLEFGLSETQKGEILGAGLWPFGISIVLFSLVVDKFGYGRSMIFAFACHVASVFLTIYATGYWHLYFGSILCGLAAGTVEAIVNPVIATMFADTKTKMLTKLHAGWAGGVALGGLLTLTIGTQEWATWQIKVGLLLIPTALYGVMMLGCKFPVNERVAAGVPYRDMLKERGIIGAIIVSYMIMMEFGRIFGLPAYVTLGIVALIAVIMGVYTFSLGRPMYSFLLLIMILLAITELGTDGWIKELLGPTMAKIGLDSGFVLVYTATIMMVLRFCIGPIVKVLKPLGVLFVSALFAAAGLYLLAGAQGALFVLITATIYGIGQTFFWPVTIGLVAERFPRGGALTINAIAGVGMLGVGILGFPLLGYWQDREIDQSLNKSEPALYQRYASEGKKTSVFGEYSALDSKELETLRLKTAMFERSAQLEQDANAPLNDGTLLNDPAFVVLVKDAFNQLEKPTAESRQMPVTDKFQRVAAAGFLINADDYALVKPDEETLASSTTAAKKTAMATVAVLPLIMAACYLALIIYFRLTGGYKAIHLTAEAKTPEPVKV